MNFSFASVRNIEFGIHFGHKTKITICRLSIKYNSSECFWQYFGDRHNTYSCRGQRVSEKASNFFADAFFDIQEQLWPWQRRQTPYPWGNHENKIHRSGKTTSSCIVFITFHVQFTKKPLQSNLSKFLTRQSETEKKSVNSDALTQLHFISMCFTWGTCLNLYKVWLPLSCTIIAKVKVVLVSL